MSYKAYYTHSKALENVIKYKALNSFISSPEPKAHR